MPHRRSPPPTLEANSPPAAPTGLAAAAGDGQVTLTWNNPADSNDNVTRYEYNVNHNDTSTGNLSGWTPWATVPGSGASTTSYTFTGLTNGREYRYHLRAVNDNGPSVGAPNAAPWFVKAVPNAPPAAPTGLAAAAGVRSVTLTWNNPGDSSITGYQYNVNHNATGTGNLTGWSPWTAIEGSGASTTSVTFNNLAGGKEYRYHLRAVNANGPSAGAPASGPPWFVSAIVIAPPPPPAAPTNLRVERVCDHKLKVRWHRSAGATGYDLEIGSANRKHWKRLLTNWPGNSWFATNWQKDRSYRFAVRAVNDGGASEWVDSALSVAPPCAVNNLRVVTSTPGEGDLGAVGGSIAASWNAGHRASAYHLDYNGTREADNIAATSLHLGGGQPGQQRHRIRAVRQRRPVQPVPQRQRGLAHGRQPRRNRRHPEPGRTRRQLARQKDRAHPGRRLFNRHQRDEPQPQRPGPQHGPHLHRLHRRRLRQRHGGHDLYHRRRPLGEQNKGDERHAEHRRTLRAVVVSGQHRAGQYLSGPRRRRHFL